MSITIRKLGKSRRLRSKKELAHKPSGHGKGKWQSRSSLWLYKRLSRRKRIIAAHSRRVNAAR